MRTLAILLAATLAAAPAPLLAQFKPGEAAKKEAAKKGAAKKGAAKKEAAKKQPPANMKGRVANQDEAAKKPAPAKPAVKLQ